VRIDDAARDARRRRSWRYVESSRTYAASFWMNKVSSSLGEGNDSEREGEKLRTRTLSAVPSSRRSNLKEHEAANIVALFRDVVQYILMGARS
jgi:hypothetical protein